MTPVAERADLLLRQIDAAEIDRRARYAAVGNLLRELRAARGIAIAEAAVDLRCRVSEITAIEEGRMHSRPGRALRRRLYTYLTAP